jgi:hypothetical protein
MRRRTKETANSFKHTDGTLLSKLEQKSGYKLRGRGCANRVRVRIAHFEHNGLDVDKRR